jgi:nucleoid-associated protein YgaU
MTLEKLTIKFEQKNEGSFTGRIRALFNPNQLSYAKTVNWTAEPTATSSKEAEYQKVRFGSSGLETLTINLFFDTYEGDAEIRPNPLEQPSAVSVLPYTNAVVALSRFDYDLHRPPICELWWGKLFVFKGVLQSLKQDLTLFLEDGTPVRATIDCTFMQYQTKDDRIKNELHSADVAKRYTVMPGDTLSSIAAALYDDPSLWRRIAEENRIDNPRRISPGQVLTIPKLR